MSIPNSKIILAGATGNLGGRIAKALLARQAHVTALVRQGTPASKLESLKALGAIVTEVDYANARELENLFKGADCVVSALSGLRETIVDAQTSLLEAAVNAGVPRFIPSDYAMDFTQLPEGVNRNLDFRKEFYARIEKAKISATSILNGAFADMLTGQAPFILFKFKRILYWQNPDQLMDFTTMDDTANFTARAAIDPTTPRFLRIAGDQVSARDLCRIAHEVYAQDFRLLRAGNLKMLEFMIRFLRFVMPDKGELYPPWQGMQYMHNMYSGLGKLKALDNARYPELKWTKISEVLAAHTP